MSYNRPWETEFDQLLRGLQGAYSGKVFDVEKNLDKVKVLFEAYYPRYSTKLSQKTIFVTIGDTVSGGGLGMDHDEYLVIEVVSNSEHEFRVQPETGFDRFKKKIKLDWEFQTGNKKFDQLYYVEMKTYEAKNLLCNREIQQVIQSLDPFVIIKVLYGGIVCSHFIEDASQLRLSNVQARMEKVVELAKLVEKG